MPETPDNPIDLTPIFSNLTTNLEFTKSFVNKTLKLKIGNGMDKSVQLGPITTKKRLEEIEKLVEITKKEGAKILCGGKRPSGFNKGYY